MEVNGIADSYLSEAIEDQTQLDEETLKKCDGGIPNSVSSQPMSASGCFECNICLDFAVDPVVTLCGHLYCWPCIYKWLQVDSTSTQQCPVCKASLSENALVPLYGRGHSRKRSQQSVEIPRRPSSVHHQDQSVPESDSPRLTADEDLYTDIHTVPLRHRHQHYHLHQHHHHYPSQGYPLGLQPSSSPTQGGMTRMMHSAAGGVLGGMAIAVLPRVFRNHQEAASMNYPSPFSSMDANGGGSPRLRRQEIEVEMSLHQIWLFLVLCTVLCLLLF